MEQNVYFGSVAPCIGDLVADHRDPSTPFLIALFGLPDQDQGSHGRGRELVSQSLPSAWATQEKR